MKNISELHASINCPTQPPKRKPAANPLSKIHRAAQAVQELQVTTVNAGADNSGRQAKLDQNRQQQTRYYEFNSCLRSYFRGYSAFLIKNQQQKHCTGDAEPSLRSEQFRCHLPCGYRAGQIGKKHRHDDETQSCQAAPPQGGDHQTKPVAHLDLQMYITAMISYRLSPPGA